jgi:hypothetical protein
LNRLEVTDEPADPAFAGRHHGLLSGLAIGAVPEIDP